MLWHDDNKYCEEINRRLPACQHAGTGQSASHQPPQPWLLSNQPPQPHSAAAGFASDCWFWSMNSATLASCAPGLMALISGAPRPCEASATAADTAPPANLTEDCALGSALMVKVSVCAAQHMTDMLRVGPAGMIQVSNGWFGTTMSGCGKQLAFASWHCCHSHEGNRRQGQAGLGRIGQGWAG